MFNHINFIFIYDILILAIVFIGSFFIGRFIGNLVKFALKNIKNNLFINLKNMQDSIRRLDKP